MSTLTLNDRSLYYSESLDALSTRPPLLLLHPAGGLHANWPPHVRRLPATNVYAPDLPGHGRSDGPGRRSISAYAADMLAFMDALGLRRAVVGGISMGGAIALTMALNTPDRLAGLLLVATGARLRVLPEILDGLKTDFEKTVDRMVGLSHGPNPPEQMVRIGRRQMLDCGPEVMHGDYAACNAFDVMDHLPQIRVPTLVVVGTADQMTPVKYARFMAEAIPNAQLAVIEGGGHMVAIETPQEVADRVDSWLATLPAG